MISRIQSLQNQKQAAHLQKKKLVLQVEISNLLEDGWQHGFDVFALIWTELIDRTEERRTQEALQDIWNGIATLHLEVKG